ncbi:MAG: hypothetical protein O7G86_18600, partial [Gammaproteobacteria bacterium]|nr:hypothetical protein [Gammaproteobacteria bacterium]
MYEITRLNTWIAKPQIKVLLPFWMLFCAGSLYGADIPTSCSIQPFSQSAEGLDTQVSVSGGTIAIFKTTG